MLNKLCSTKYAQQISLIILRDHSRGSLWMIDHSGGLSQYWTHLLLFHMVLTSPDTSVLVAASTTMMPSLSASM